MQMWPWNLYFNLAILKCPKSQLIQSSSVYLKCESTNIFFALDVIVFYQAGSRSIIGKLRRFVHIEWIIIVRFSKRLIYRRPFHLFLFVSFICTYSLHEKNILSILERWKPCVVIFSCNHIKRAFKYYMIN